MSALDYIAANPAHGIAALALIAMVVVSVIQRLMKIALVVVIGAVVYGYFLHHQGALMKRPGVEHLVDDMAAKKGLVQDTKQKLEEAAKSAAEKLDRE